MDNAAKITIDDIALKNKIFVRGAVSKDQSTVMARMVIVQERAAKAKEKQE